jgi:hypothetical protein
MTLARGGARRHARSMFAITEADIEAICAEFDRSAGARECARMIARWRPAPDGETAPEASRDPG